MATMTLKMKTYTKTLVEELTRMFQIFGIEQVFPLLPRQYKNSKIGDSVKIQMMKGEFEIINIVPIEELGLNIQEQCERISVVLREHRPPAWETWKAEFPAVAILRKK